MDPFWSDNFGNPMSLHSVGRQARQEVELARHNIAAYFNVADEEIIFTSGATESNNLAVKGVTKAIIRYIKRYSSRFSLPQNFIPHIITTAYEHHCLLDSVRELERDGLAEVTFIQPDKEGLISPESITKAIKDNTILVSVMYVNNEIGTVNDLETIGKLISKTFLRRKEKAGIADKEALPIYFHSDITQGVNYLECNAKKFNLDLFSFSGHKIYGPKGVGALGVKKNILIEKIQQGGDQEFNLRAGTHNLTGIIGLASAINEVSKSRTGEGRKIKELRDYFLKKISQEIKNFQINGSVKRRIANNLNLSFAAVEGESLLLLLSEAGVYCSTGSACSSESLEPSHTLLSIGCTHPEAHSSLRFSLGTQTTKKDLDRTVKILATSIAKLRKITGSIEIIN